MPAAGAPTPPSLHHPAPLPGAERSSVQAEQGTAVFPKGCCKEQEVLWKGWGPEVQVSPCLHSAPAVSVTGHWFCLSASCVSP